MQGILSRTITLASLLLISICSTGGQEVQSPQAEKSKPPVKMEQRGRILGIGGIFFKSANRDQMREWYSKHLGLADKGSGAGWPTLSTRTANRFRAVGALSFRAFAKGRELRM
jgi:hypothetical protein